MPEKEQKYLTKISEIEKEINLLEPLKEKSEYKLKINKLQSQKEKLPIEFAEIKANLESKLKDLKINNQNQHIDIDETENLLKPRNEKFSIEKQKKADFIEKDFKFDFEKEKSALDILTSLIFGQTIKENYKKEYEYNTNNTNSFFEIFKYEMSTELNWKKGLISILKKDIPTPKIFRIHEHDNLADAKIAQIMDETEITITDNYNRKGYKKKIIKSDIPDIFPIWYALKISLKNNFTIKNTLKFYYLSLDNGIYAKIFPRKNRKITDDFSVALFLLENSFDRSCYIYSGYTRSGFLLNWGIYLNYQEWIFEVYFYADALLLSNSNGFQPIQSISDSKKRDDEISSQDDEDYWSDDD